MTFCRNAALKPFGNFLLMAKLGFRCCLISLSLAYCVAFARGNVVPAFLFSDNAVLQRDKPIPVWGTAAASEKVVVSFAGQTVATTADAPGKWRVDLPALNLLHPDRSFDQRKQYPPDKAAGKSLTAKAGRTLGRLPRGTLPPRNALRPFQRHDPSAGALCVPGHDLVSGRGQRRQPCGLYEGFSVDDQRVARAVWPRRLPFLATLLVTSPEVTDPVTVQYGWRDAAKASLYNREGLPAVPFRTDNWE